MALTLALPLAATVANVKSITTGGFADSSGTITVNATAHGFITGDNVYVSGAPTPATSGSYNGFTGPITASTNSFTYASSASSGAAVGSNTTVQGTCHVRSISATTTSAAIVTPKRLIPGNVVRVRLSWPAGTFAGSWVITACPRIASVRADGSVVDNTYLVPNATSNPELVLTLSALSSGGTALMQFPAMEDFKLVATKASTATPLTVEVLTPSVPR